VLRIQIPDHESTALRAASSRPSSRSVAALYPAISVPSKVREFTSYSRTASSAPATANRFPSTLRSRAATSPFTPGKGRFRSRACPGRGPRAARRGCGDDGVPRRVDRDDIGHRLADSGTRLCIPALQLRFEAGKTNGEQHGRLGAGLQIDEVYGGPAVNQSEGPGTSEQRPDVTLLPTCVVRRAPSEVVKTRTGPLRCPAAASIVSWSGGLPHRRRQAGACGYHR
jgi:hypothetical protein